MWTNAAEGRGGGRGSVGIVVRHLAGGGDEGAVAAASAVRGEAARLPGGRRRLLHDHLGRHFTYFGDTVRLLAYARAALL